MKRIITYLSVFAALLAVSCNRIEPTDFSGETDQLRIALRSSDMETRAIEVSEDPNAVDNENVINTVDYFFFKKSDGTMLIEHGSKAFTAEEERILTFDTSENGQYKDLRKPFYAYFLVNYKDDKGKAIDHTKNDWTWATVQALPITTEFYKTKKDELGTTVNDNAFKVPEFVMDSGEKLVYVKADTQGQAVEKKVTLYHVAAKIVLNFTVAESVTALGDTWKPDMSQTTLRFWNALKKTTVKGEPVQRTETSDKKNYFNYLDEKPIEGEGSYSSRIYYTYPQQFGTKSESGKVTYNNGEPYIKMTFVWEGQNTLGATRFYYKILLPNLEKIERNKFYVLNVNIDQLGGVEDEYELVSDHYYVADWKTLADIAQSGVTESRFLDIALSTYSFYGQDEMNVPVTSSHPIKITNITKSKEVFKSGASTDVTLDAGYPKTNGNTDFTLKHTLVTDPTKTNYDCGIITYTVTVRHADDENNTGLVKTVTIKQYPPVYIKAEQSNGYAFVNYYTTGGGWSPRREYGSAGHNCYNTDEDDIGSLPERNSITGEETGNKNRNQYTVYVSVLPSSSSYRIGDPRGPKGGVANLGNQISNNYRPTAENTQNVIAPAFKMASSYGKTHDLIFDRAEERCAAYQENGYPAGRWRVPTVAEIEFCIDLYENGHIPELYQTGHNNYLYSNNYRLFDTYWAGGMYAYAGSLYKTESGTSSAEKLTDSNYDSYNSYYGYQIYKKRVNSRDYYYTSAVRCVYDVWYWGDEKDTAHMTTWGGFQTD